MYVDLLTICNEGWTSWLKFNILQPKLGQITKYEPKKCIWYPGCKSSWKNMHNEASKCGELKNKKSGI